MLQKLGALNIELGGRSCDCGLATNYILSAMFTRSAYKYPFLCLLLLVLQTVKFNATLAMRLVVQRVKSASVTVEGQMVSQIGPGILALVGLHEHDERRDLQECCKKLLACKLWENDSGGLWRHSVKQKGFEVLLVSQFTLYGTLSKKNQPDYKLAMKSEPARKLYGEFLSTVREAYESERVKDGVFGEMMVSDAGICPEQ